MEIPKTLFLFHLQEWDGVCGSASLDIMTSFTCRKGSLLHLGLGQQVLKPRLRVAVLLSLSSAHTNQQLPSFWNNPATGSVPVVTCCGGHIPMGIMCCGAPVPWSSLLLRWGESKLGQLMAEGTAVRERGHTRLAVHIQSTLGRPPRPLSRTAPKKVKTAITNRCLSEGL